jgi:hypothetical protein
MTKQIVNLIENSFLSLGFGTCSEFLTYMTANEIINSAYNIPSGPLELIAGVGLLGLTMSGIAGVWAYDSYIKNKREGGTIK